MPPNNINSNPHADSYATFTGADTPREYIQSIRERLFDTVLWHLEELARLGDQDGIRTIFQFARPNINIGWDVLWRISEIKTVLAQLAADNTDLRFRLSEWYIEPEPENTTEPQEDDGIYARDDDRGNTPGSS